MTKRMILTPRTTTLSKHFRFESRNGLPGGPVRITRFFHQKMSPRYFNKLNFNRSTKFSNLSSEEWSALKSLRKRKDIVIKAADKGGA